MSQTDTVESPPAAKRPGLIKKIILPLVLIGGLATAGHFIMESFSVEKTDDAFITGHVHRIGAGVAGTLMDVKVDENQEVKAGDLLAKIDPLEFEIMEKQAVAALEQAKAMLAQSEAKVAQAKSADLQADAAVAMANAEIQEKQSKLELARITLNRDESLLKGETRAVSQSDVDKARNDMTGAEASLGGSIAKLESARAGKQANASAIALAEAESSAAKADIDAREAAILEAQRQCSLTDVIAPVSGRIGNRNAESGNRVQLGQSLYALVEEDYWIVGNFKETQLKKMQVGQKVDITIDSLGGKHFTGKVDSFSPSTGAQFALLPPDNATGNFTKVVQRVPVKIVFDADSIRGFEEALRPGLSTVVKVKL